ncbi:tol-pal system-associated acyl-CoA thioesterase [Palleronia sp. LCG004]|uniref:tol-pal system-associated acyl-CoA thioesterase n=1 Tax=Palleronia sp. LCG004 TaxID=3079304 RepID=UPI002943A771|nr:tol-pal system-associated acyl-CoA thioesterase [Palleronia sp. LCG004]WOI55841.1 tol-pal system-associated acyl-CoA thioesterase [Palleronia sp. LCG004]
MSHLFPVTVYYEDTDMGGIVYHANYLKFIERARSDWVRKQGVDQIALREAGIAFAVRRINAEFHAPARLDDRLTVETSVMKAGGARMVLEQVVTRSATSLFRAEVELAALDMASGRPARLPEVLRRAE